MASAEADVPPSARERLARKTMLTTAGKAGGNHSYNNEEKVAFTEHINNCLGSDAFLVERGYVPMDPASADLFKRINDGIMLCKLINKAQADTVDERALNLPDGKKDMNLWEKQENNNIVINSAKSIGCQVVNIHAPDLIRAFEDHKEHLVLGLVWQIVKQQLLNKISIAECPELVVLAVEGEDLPTLMKQSPEEILLRWVNHHLAKDGAGRKATNLGSDLKDSEIYFHLLHSLDADKCRLDGLTIADPTERAAAMLAAARSLGVPEFLKPSDVTSGNKRLNLAYCAQIFKVKHGLVLDKEKAVEIEAATHSEELDDDAREERVFRMWINSLDLGGGDWRCQSLFNDLSDGIALLEAIDKVAPGTVDMKKVNSDRAKLNTFKKVENCNLAVSMGKTLGLSLPGLGGTDIANSNRKLVLGFVWQLMRHQIVDMLKELGGGKAPKDSDILAWANNTVAASGKESRITSFKDPSLSSGVFLLDLLAAVDPRAVNTALVTSGESVEDKAKNAKYVLSVARKIGAVVYLTWEDIRDVKPKMIMTLLAAIMVKASHSGAAGASHAASSAGGSDSIAKVGEAFASLTAEE